MKDALTMAHINLYAVLRNLEDLCEMDMEMKQLIAQRTLTIQLRVKEGPVGRLIFKDGKCRFEKGVGPANIKLSFRSPQHFNDMVSGTAKPIITKGFTQLGFLMGDFVKLTERLSYYLKPTEALLKEPRFTRINTVLTAYTAFFALSEIGNVGEVGKLVAHRIPNGTIAVVVQDGPALTIEAKDGKLAATKGMPAKYRASMSFDSLETAGALLNGKIDSYSCIASKKVELRGFIPMLDNMNKLLGQVSGYL